MPSAVIAWRLTVQYACDKGKPASCRCHVLPPFDVRNTAGTPPGEVRGQTSEPSIGNTHAEFGSRGCSVIGKPILPTFFGMPLPMSIHVSDGRSMRNMPQ